MMGEFSEKVYDIVSSIPSGYVATYGQIAIALGNVKFARAVGNALHENSDPVTVPCFKVVNCKGELTDAFAFGGREAQRELLMRDGIVVEDFRVDLDKYQVKNLNEKSIREGVGVSEL